MNENITKNLNEIEGLYLSKPISEATHVYTLRTWLLRKCFLLRSNGRFDV